jgi:hypothetical protein
MKDNVSSNLIICGLGGLVIMIGGSVIGGLVMIIGGRVGLGVMA